MCLYMVLIFFSCFGLLWLPSVRSHFLPFIGVQNGNQPEVTTECVEAAVPAAKIRVPPKCRRYAWPCNVTSAGRLGCDGFDLDEEIARGSRLLFLAEFLESGIGAQRIPVWTES